MGRVTSTVLLTIATWASTAIASSAQVVDLSVPGPSGTAFEWVGPQANSRAGTSLLRADMSGDVDRMDLIVGAPGAGARGEGQTYILFMGPPYGTASLTTAATVILSGEAAGDQFGAATSAGMIVRREFQPLPPRDLLVAAPGALGGRGAVYLFPGPFHYGDTRSASAAPFRITGAPGDRLGSAIIATDLDGDGYRDIVMSAPGTGRIYVVFGGPSLAGTWDLNTRAANLTITMPAMAVAFGSADFNNDGFKDLAIGAPSAANGSGAVYLVMGRSRGAFTSGFALAAGADATVTGIDVGDAAGAGVQSADFDGDGVQDLIVSAPGAAGPNNSRPNAGEAYVFWGGSRFSITRGFAAADVTIYGAAAGDGFGTTTARGAIRRAEQDDLIFLAPGGSASGDIDIVYGAQRGRLATVIDLAAGVDRVLRGDPATAPLRSIVAMQVTGLGDDIVAAAPNEAVQSNAAAGALFVVYSPTLIASPRTPSITVAQGSTETVVVELSNIGTLNIPWAARSNTSWLTLSSGLGNSSASSQGQLTFTITPGNLPPGVYNGGYTFASLSRALAWPDSAGVTMIVTPGITTTPAAGNPFGLPDPPDEGSPDGVFTPTGTDVSVVVARDFLVRFTNVSVAGKTSVSILSTANSPPSTSGGSFGPWTYAVSTTAQFNGPVTVAIAYQDFAPQSQGAIRLNGGRADLTAWTDLSRHVIWGSNANVSGTYYVGLAPPKVNSLTVGPSASAPAGTTVTFTASADGSGGALAYQFWRYDSAGGWRIAQDYSAANTYSWTTGPSDVGTHYAQVWVRRADSTARYEGWAGTTVNVGTPQPLTVTGIVASENLPAPAGRRLTFTAQSAGGTGPIQFQFWRYDGAAWSPVQDYGTSSSYSWQTTAADQGSHSIQVWAKNAGSTNRYDAWLGTSATLTAPAPLTVTDLSADVTLPAPAGTTVTFSATTAGGAGPLQYQFWRYDAATGWTVVQDYSASNTLTWSTGGGDVGTHSVQVWVRNAGSTARYDAWAGSGMFTISSPPSPRVTSLTSNVPVPIQAGSWITWTATAASGNSTPLEYKFWRYDAATGWHLVQDYGADASYVWATGAMDFGTHSLQVWVRRVGSTANYESWLGTGMFTVNGPGPVSVTSLTSSVPLPAAAGTTIVWRATTSGGYGPMQYQFWRYDSAGGWRIVQPYGASSTYTWTTTGADAGSHAIQVWVRQNGSTATYDAWAGSGMFTINP